MATPRTAGRVAPAPAPRRRRPRRRVLLLLAGVLLAVVAVTVVWFQPQKLLYDQRVDEPFPATASTAPASPPVASPARPAPAELATGGFVSREHATHGTARVLRLADGRVVVRFEGFATSNGPALVVWLSGNPAAGPAGAFADRHVDLGPLKGNIGDQNYPVPATVDVTGYRSVVVWCDRFSVPFGAADLAPSP